MRDPRDDSSSSPTRLREWGGSASTSEFANGARFTPGQLIGHRYRIAALVGRGGIGEVYRADDTRLGQPVALKYVAEAVSSNPDVLHRLYSELRLGRTVSHPNVCRLYDLVEVEGHHFIAMEYVDGEDLASLLRRIGRLPGDKALALARDICSGLAAAHDRGVIHRDLKPGNVMIDGRGTARITDFGLAAVAGDEAGLVKLAGTPRYMAPEQLDGGNASVRSDIYALGLVMFEMFTGRPRFAGTGIAELRREHSEAKQPPGSIVDRLDPQVERVILRCLDENPALRPPSARAVLAALPGGDPLQAALDAGQTPSPELVAAAGQVGDISVRRGWILLATLTALLALATVVQYEASLESRLPRLKSREALIDRARDLIATFGGSEPADVNFGWIVNAGLLAEVRKDQRWERWERLRSAPPSALFFAFRQGSEPLIPWNLRYVTAGDPPETVPGMASAILDGQGRLVRFRRVSVVSETPKVVGWEAFFRAADLDFNRFRAVPPRGGVPFEHDRSLAWTGPMWRGRGELRVEGATSRGAPVYFEVIEPWRGALATSTSFKFSIGQQLVSAVIMFITLFAMVFARRNLLLGRADRRGALRVAVFIGCTMLIGTFSIGDHVLNATAEWYIILTAVGSSLVAASQGWICYLAVEPYLRRRFPHTFIAWSRLLAGRYRDPLVGHDFLLGAIAGTVAVVLANTATYVTQTVGAVGTPVSRLADVSMDTPRGIGFALSYHLAIGVAYALGWATLLLLFRLLTRNDFAAFALLLLAVAPWQMTGQPLLQYPLGMIAVLPLVLVLRQVGALALGAGIFFHFALLRTPLTYDLTQWFAFRSAAVLLVLFALGAYAFLVALGGKPLFGTFPLEEEARA